MAGQGSARVSLREIDESQVRSQEILPSGTPAGVIGTAKKGPAFVPQTVANIQQFEEIFGSFSDRSNDSNSNRFGPIALNEWMNNSEAGTFVRVLGVGDGTAATTNSVNDAGFVVGERLVQPSTPTTNPGKLGKNIFATNDSAANGTNGRTHFLGCFMSASADSNFFKDAGIQTSDQAVPVIRGVLMTPQGIRATLNPGMLLSGSDDTSPQTHIPSNNNVRNVNINGAGFGTSGGSDLGGYIYGKVGSNQEFTLLLNGLTNLDNNSVITCSFDPDSVNYFAKALNTDSTKIQEYGHYLHSHWDISREVATPSLRNLITNGVDADDSTLSGFCLVNEKLTDNTLPNYEDFSSRFRTARSPWVVSQALNSNKFDRSGLSSSDCKKLFKLHCLDDGEIGSNLYRVLISNVSLGTRGGFGSFNLALERFDSDPITGTPIIEWKNINLDPESRNFIGRIIGDKHIYWDFDKREDRQRMVETGTHPVRNKYVRVEVHPDVINGDIDSSLLPVGFQGPGFIKTNHTDNFSGSFGTISTSVYSDPPSATELAEENVILNTAQVLPIPFVRSISKLAGSGEDVSATIIKDSKLPWGVKFGVKRSLDNVNKELSENEFNHSLASWTKYFSDTTANPAYIEDTEENDTFQNNFFSLEKIHVSTGSNGKIDNWSGSEYRRDGSVGAKSRFVDINTDAKGTNVPFLKFRFFMQGGFDGVNIFDKEKKNLTGLAALREGLDENSNNIFSGPTVVSYKKGVDVLKEKSTFDLQLLAIPGIRSSVVTDHAIAACEDRFDAMLVMDIEEIDNSVDMNHIVDGTDIPSVSNTITKFTNRELDTSFAAAYFPDVMSRKPRSTETIVVPPSVVMLGAISRNDFLADPWFAPAGLQRGRLNASDTRLRMPRSVLNELYDADINPIYVPAGRIGEVFTFGQKTLLRDQSALDRINVRRLLIDVRRKVKKIAESLLFEPNRASTLARFSKLVEPIMSDVKKRRGVDRYKIQIDTNTTTQNDIENNTIRGKIYLQPIKSVEFISLDFVVTNSINE